MYKILGLLSLCVLIFGFNLSLNADPRTDLTRCSEISNSDDRLDCYDTVANYYKNTSKALSPDILPISSTNPEQKKPVVQEKPSSSVDLTQDQGTTPSAEQRFGQLDRDGIESIESNLIGEFTKWEKGMLLKLENGQVWKVLSRKTGYKKMVNPKVTISKGFFGSYNAEVEGLNAKAKVKRIK